MTGEVLLMLSLYSLGSGWPCVRNPLCLCWWGCPWMVDGWKALSDSLCPVGVGFWAALCQNQGGMLLQVRTPLCLWEWGFCHALHQNSSLCLCLWECPWMDGWPCPDLWMLELFLGFWLHRAFQWGSPIHRNLRWESPLSWPCLVLIRLGSKSTTELFVKTLGRATKWTPWL